MERKRLTKENWLIESNAELRKRLKKYEDNEFGVDSYYNK